LNRGGLFSSVLYIHCEKWNAIGDRFMQVLRHIWKQAPALILLLLFLSGWLIVPLTLAAPEPITCGMVCCEESGECCCFVSRQAHYHDDGDTDEESRLIAFRQGCQSNCTTPPSVSSHTFQPKTLPSLLRLELIAPDEPFAPQWHKPDQLELGRNSAPRAPPIFS